jgi:2'-5' RNA ligase
VRQFLALELSCDTRHEIARLAARLAAAGSGWRALPADALHLTLRFLGEVSEDRDRSARRAFRAAASEVSGFELRIGGLGAFPARGRPRILWLGVAEPSGRLLELQAVLERAAQALGFAPESREFHPHLTLARSRTGGAARGPAGGEAAGTWLERVGRATLFQSVLSPAGARYTLLESFPLAAVTYPLRCR